MDRELDALPGAVRGEGIVARRLGDVMLLRTGTPGTGEKG
jgi:hypothetical protein